MHTFEAPGLKKYLEEEYARRAQYVKDISNAIMANKQYPDRFDTLAIEAMKIILPHHLSTIKADYPEVEWLEESHTIADKCACLVEDMIIEIDRIRKDFNEDL